MAAKKRPYRKNLTSYGLIYLGGEELEISVKNLSITGLLAELKGNNTSSDIKEMFYAIELSSTIDIYLPEMRLAGEAEITRADMNNDIVLLALEFRYLSYEVSDMLYQRKSYRKNISAPGQIVFNQKKYTFFTRNVSVDGMTIMLKENIIVSKDTTTIFDLQRMDLRGQVKVIWVDHAEDNSTIMGVQYLQLEKEGVSGIPRFSLEGYKKDIW